MNAALLRLVDYLGHIEQAIERIGRFVGPAGQPGFMADDMVQDAVIRNLEVIGEACRNIETRFPDFARAHPELPLTAAYQMRNAVAHGYFRVDLDIVWRTVVSDLPALGEKVRAALIDLDVNGLPGLKT